MLTLDLGGAWPGAHTPVRAEAEEAVSACWRVVTDLIADSGDVDPADLLQKPATITLRGTGPGRVFSGLVTGFALMGVLPQARYWYRLTIETGLRLFAYTRRSRVFCTEQPATVAGVISQVLASGIGARAPESLRFDLKTTTYPARDMVVQYDESDLDFLSRLAEDAGIFWVLDQTQGAESLLFGDSNVCFPIIQADGADDAAGGQETSPGVLSYRPRIAVGDTAPAVRGATLTSTVVPQSVQLNEWAPTNPAVALLTASAPNAGGVGQIVSAGDEHYDDIAWGRTLATIRAEEAAAGRRVLEATSDVGPVAAGHVFTLDGHPAGGVDGRYVILSVSHHAWQSVAGAEFILGETRTGSGYGNTFRAIPATVPFRPARRTPWPSVAGLVRAVVDGAATGWSDVDANGFYRIVFAFDPATHPPGQASAPVRLLAPYGGPDEGLHFPLRPGAQVLVAFHNGDPDRPVIVGAVPDTVQKSLVSQTNRKTHMIRTAGGIVMRLNDGS